MKFKYMFNKCKSLKPVDLSNFNTSNVTDMSNMFSYCESLETLDLSNFDTSNVIWMTSMFNLCNSLKSLNLSNFDTSNVKSMHSMFVGCKSLEYLDLSNFIPTSSNIVAGNMFKDCDNLKYIKCKQEFKDWSMSWQYYIGLPKNMINGEGVCEIVDWF